jgi:hypothetical protein
MYGDPIVTLHIKLFALTTYKFSGNIQVAVTSINVSPISTHWHCSFIYKFVVFSQSVYTACAADSKKVINQLSVKTKWQMAECFY